MTLLPEDALPSGGLKPHQMHLQPYPQTRLTAPAHLTFQGYCMQWRAAEKVEGEKPQKASPVEKDADQGLLRPQKSEILLVSLYEKQSWKPGSLWHCSSLQDKMHSDARKDHILSSYGFKSAHWVLFEEEKTAFVQLFFELVEIEQGQERTKALQKASLQETLKNELQHLP